MFRRFVLPPFSGWLHFSTHISQFSHLGHGGSTFLRKVRTFHHYNPEIQKKTIIWSTALVKTWKLLWPRLSEDGNTAIAASRLVVVRMSVQQQQQLRLPFPSVLSVCSSHYTNTYACLKFFQSPESKIIHLEVICSVLWLACPLQIRLPALKWELTRCWGMLSTHSTSPSPTCYIFTNPKWLAWSSWFLASVSSSGSRIPCLRRTGSGGTRRRAVHFVLAIPFTVSNT